MLSPYVEELQQTLQEYANASIAQQQKAYLKDLFEHYGIKAPVRRSITKYLLTKEARPFKEELDTIVKELWTLDQREFQHFGLDLCDKYKRQWVKSDLSLFEHMVVHKSWWDTVDFIAVNLMGPYFKQFPELIETKMEEWIQSQNLWLQRCTLIFQLKYKKDTNTALLSRCILQLNHTKEFFLNKAIGWALREYSKTNPKWVMEFTDQQQLHPLSKREALRLM